MRIFVDTNIVVELLENRKESDNIDRIFEAIETRQWEKVLSVGSFYTLTFLIERIIRRQGIGNPACVEKLREILHQLLESFEIVDLDKETLKRGIGNKDFTDLEDSYQYVAALSANSDVLLTINTSDFRYASQSRISIVSPREFIERFL